MEAGKAASVNCPPSSYPTYLLWEEPFGDFMLLHLPMLTAMQIGCHLMVPVFRNLQMADTCKLAPPQIFQSLFTHLEPVAVVKIVPVPTKFVVGSPVPLQS